MDNSAHVVFNAWDRSYFSILKKEIHNLAFSAGFNEQKIAQIDIVVAEITSNLVKHAGGGELLVRIVAETIPYIELISIDSGIGMTDPRKMIDDGMSTANTLGNGLGAIRRLSDVFDIYSLKDWGTILLARLYKDTPDQSVKKPSAEVKTIIVAKTGETLSGDAAYFDINARRAKIFLGDGLGHGPEANKAVQKAIEAIKVFPGEAPIDILRFLHTEVKKTRGLVGTVVVYSFDEKKWRICGIGNIATRIQEANTSKTYMSYNGVIGMNIPNTLNEQEVAREHGQILIMCSDGIKSRWDIQKFTGILKCDLSILAAAIYKDFARHTDDISIVVSRINTKVQ